jgi:hypothetical protein
MAVVISTTVRHECGSTETITAPQLGYVKQVAGSVFGNENLKRDDIEQDRRGESEQGKG